MKKVFRSAVLLMAAIAFPMGFTSCSSSNDDPVDDSKYSDKTYGNEAMDACNELCNALTAAYNAVNDAQLSDEQTTYLKNVCANAVDKTIQPTYTQLGDAVEKLQKALGSKSVTEMTQTDVDNACAAFKDARALWEKSEAFLGGAASDFEIDPHIDSWPLNRTLLHNYFRGTQADKDAAIEEQSILGFHALEFVLFRNGQPRKVSEFKSNDTYNGFTDITGAEELQYAEAVAKDLVNHVYELQVSWSENPDPTRLAAVKAAGLNYRTETYGKSYEWNLKNAGNAQSTFPTLKAAIQQLLSMDEGSCLGIANEVGTAKIANPFQSGDISYVESPYSYNSILDFQNNIRSIENMWYGGTNGKSSNAQYSFHQFFKDNATAKGAAVEAAIEKAISKIGGMPYPFVKYVSTVWGKKFDETPVPDSDEE